MGDDVFMMKKKIATMLTIYVLFLSLVVATIPTFNAGEVFCAVKGGLYIDGNPASLGEAEVQLIFEDPFEIFSCTTFAWDNGFNYNINTVSNGRWRDEGDTGVFRVHVNSYNFLSPYDNVTFTVSEGIHHVDLHVNRNDTSPPNKPSNISPLDGAVVDIDTGIMLSVEVSDPDGDFMDVYFYDTLDNLIGTVRYVTSGGTASITWQGLTEGTDYSWYAVASDSIKQTSSPVWSFSTKAVDEEPGNETPEEELPGEEVENLPPFADADGPYKGLVGEEIIFDGSNSYDPDGNITLWRWDFGDGTTAEGETAVHVYHKRGRYPVFLTVTDEEGLTDVDETIVIVTAANIPPSNPEITGPVEGNKGVEYKYSVVSTDEDNDTIKYTFDWDDGTSNTSGFLPSGVPFSATHSWSSAGRYTVTATAYDNQTTSQSELTVFIDAVNVGNIGYLTDDDGDGVYDIFHNQMVETEAGPDDVGNYLIDVDGDGSWDYVFNPNTEELTEYEPTPEPSREKKGVSTSIILLGTLAAVLFILFSVLSSRKKSETKKPEKRASKK